MGFCKATSKFVVEWWTLDQTGCVCLIGTCSLKYTHTSSLKIGGDKKHSGEHELRLYNFGANPANRGKIDNLGTKWIIWIISNLFYSFQNLLNAVRYSVFDPFAYGRSLFISPLSNQQTSWGSLLLFQVQENVPSPTSPGLTVSLVHGQACPVRLPWTAVTAPDLTLPRISHWWGAHIPHLTSNLCDLEKRFRGRKLRFRKG